MDHIPSKTLTTPGESLPFYADGEWSIADVERDTGVAKDTLRAWERRYGFPAPARDAHGERRYDADSVARLRVLRRLLLAGHRPGRVVTLPLADLQRLAARAAGAGAASDAAATPGTTSSAVPAAARPGPSTDDRAVAVAAQIVQALQRTDVTAVRRALQGELARRGLAGLLVEVLAPVNVAIGDAWMTGGLGVAEEHLYTESVQGLVRQALGTLPEPADGGAPRVLLSTLPGEPHLLGLLMAEVMLRLEGCSCWSLGGQTPIADLVGAAAKVGADIVALSVTPVMRPRTLTAALAALDRALPARTALWVGGAGARRERHWPARVNNFTHLAEITEAVHGWRQSAAG